MLALCMERSRITLLETRRSDRPPMIYVAGPYSVPDPVANTYRIVKIADELLAAGFVPIVPHLSLAWHLISPKPYETWIAYDRQLLLRCDAVLRVPGQSTGATAEVEFAAELGIPVIHPRSALPCDCVAAVTAWFDL